MGSIAHVEDGKKELVKDVHRLAKLGVRLYDSTSGCVSVRPSFESSLVVEVKKGQHLDPVLMELKDSVSVKINESFALGGDNILRYRTGCVYQMWMIYRPGSFQRPMVSDIPYIQVPPRCILILNRSISGMA